MPRNATTGVFTRVSNSFSNPVFGTLIDPTDADALFDDQDVGLNPPQLAGPLNIINTMTLGTSGTAAGTLGFFNATSGSITLSPPAGALGTVTLTIPDATDTLVGRATTDNLTNKTYNKVTITAPATSATLTLIDGTTLTGPAASGTVMTLGNNETVTGVKTFGSAGAVGKLAIAGNTSGSTVLNATAIASGTLTLPAATDTLVGKATTDTLTNKTFDTAGTGNSFSINGVAVTANTGTGAVARAAGPTFTTPTLGSAVATNVTFSPTTGGIVGTTTNDNANAGVVGEFVSATVLAGSAVSLSSTTTANITSISLTAGDWDVNANVWSSNNAATTFTGFEAAINTTSATLPTRPGAGADSQQLPPTGTNIGFSLGPTRISISGTTTVYLVVNATFAVNSAAAYGFLRARRIR